MLVDTQGYTVIVMSDPTGGYVAQVQELPGCITQGENWQDLGEMVTDAIKCWLGAAEEDKWDIPEPIDHLLSTIAVETSECNVAHCHAVAHHCCMWCGMPICNGHAVSREDWNGDPDMACVLCTGLHKP